MKINVLYFGKIAALTQLKSEVVEMQGDVCTVKELQIKLGANYVELKNSTFRVAVNRALRNDKDLISDQDEVAFLPPYAGG